MIPSDKAKILYNTFRELGASDYMAKQSAVIVINEIQKFTTMPEHLNVFWAEVKNEIEKI